MIRKVFLLGALSIASTAPAIASDKLTPNMQPVVVGDPAEWFGPDNYPLDAIRANRQGRVVAEAGVDSGGRAASCRIAISSGTTSLDDKVCEIALAHLTFNPATDRKGRPVSGTYYPPVMWHLPGTVNEVDVSKGDPGDTDMAIEIKIDADGKVVACKVLTMKINQPPVDPCVNSKPGSDAHVHWVRDGKPVGGTFTQRFTTHTVTDKQ